MGNEKRLFLLAVMTVLMSTVGYGEIPNKIKVGEEYINSTSETLSKPTEVNGTLTNTDKGIIEVDVDKGIHLNNNNAVLNNSGTINVNKAVGIYLGKGTVNNEGTINIKLDKTSTKNTVRIDGTFNNTGTIVNDGKVVINKTGILNQLSGTITNNNQIDINAETSKAGIKINSGTFTNTEDKGTINVKSGVGVSTVGENSSFVNKGIITGNKDSVGIKAETNSYVENTGKISSTNGKFAINLMESTLNNTGTIENTGNVGVNIRNGFFVNNGKVSASKFAIKSNKGNNTVYLKNKSEIKGTIQGDVGVDVLGLETGKYNNLNVADYDAIVVRNGNVEIVNSNISLSHNNATEEYIQNAKDKMNEADKKDGTSGDLIISNSNLSINLSENSNKIIDADSLTFDGDILLRFDGSEQKEYNVNDILGINSIDIENANFIKTVIWSYNKNDADELIARKRGYDEIINKPQLGEFSKVFQNPNGELYKKVVEDLENLKTDEEFNTAMTQLSGGLHGYTVDIAAVNSRTLSNTMKERALTRDYLIKRPVSSWTQDIMYIDNNHRFGGLMDVDYKETGAMGISEKQILSNGRVGLVYGGSSGKADASEYGNIDVDTAYFGGYYNHEFNDKWSLNSNANFVYTHNKVTRNVNFGKVNHTFKSNYPTYTVGVGSSLIYTVKDDLYNKAHFYAGIDVNRIMQGMITEQEDSKFDNASELAVRKKGSANDKSYYSIVPSAGFMVQNTGCIFDKKYRIGADLNWETEVGNIKDGKRLHMKGIPSEYKVETTERENIFSYSLFGALNLTEDLAVNAKYTSMFSDEYDADMVSAGFEYKMDTMGDNGIFGPIFYGLENHKPKSDRWAGTFSLMLENEDATDRTYWDSNGKLVGGDYATSNEYKPKFTLSLNDKETNWSYYFEGYYKSNDFIKNPKENEESSHASRIHGEARWSDTYSKGKYGINIGYRNETSNKPSFSDKKNSSRIQRGVHQLRLTPNFTYELGNGFTFTGKTTGIFEYNYTGPVKDGQMDFLMENEYGIVYTGFMPRWRMSLIYFRDDRWYDNSNLKITGYKDNGEMKTEFYTASARYQLGQIRPTVIYYFGNGGSFKFDMRIPLGNGQWYNDKNGTKGAEAYEVRYGFNYYHPVTPGLTMNVGGTFLNIKNKAATGDVTRSYSFRPNIGFSYSF